jgi:pimeloyl-ACP methyl ester carboxylesterase
VKLATNTIQGDLWYTFREADHAKGCCFFMHGLGDSHKSFVDLAQRLHANGIHTVLYDLPGFGKNRDLTSSLEQNLTVFDELVTANSMMAQPNAYVGHSLGGLLLLLWRALKQRGHEPVLVIEPSITEADRSFFEQIREPPNGIGYDGFLQRPRSLRGDHLQLFESSLRSCNTASFRRYVVEVLQKFDEYRAIIMDSAMQFAHLFSSRSPGAHERRSLSVHPWIVNREVPGASHWVHHDAPSHVAEILLQQIRSSMNQHPTPHMT